MSKQQQQPPIDQISLFAKASKKAGFLSSQVTNGETIVRLKEACQLAQREMEIAALKHAHLIHELNKTMEPYANGIQEAYGLAKAIGQIVAFKVALEKMDYPKNPFLMAKLFEFSTNTIVWRTNSIQGGILDIQELNKSPAYLAASFDLSRKVVNFKEIRDRCVHVQEATTRKKAKVLDLYNDIIRQFDEFLTDEETGFIYATQDPFPPREITLEEADEPEVA